MQDHAPHHLFGPQGIFVTLNRTNDCSPARDGFSNLFEFAFGRSPTRTGPSPVTAANTVATTLVEVPLPGCDRGFGRVRVME